MNLKEYITTKRNKFRKLNQQEARILEIPWPLEEGWLELRREISPYKLKLLQTARITRRLPLNPWFYGFFKEQEPSPCITIYP